MRFAFALVLAAAAHASAQPASEADRLFEEGRALLEAGKYDEACAKFELSIAKDPRAIGTLMNLGLCNERSGRSATALHKFQEAFDRANEAGLAGAKAQAEDALAKLLPKVPVVTITRAAQALPGEKLVVDDAVVPLGKTTLELDPGRHYLVLTAPGRLPFETRIEVVVADRKTIKLPALQLPEQSTVVTTTASTRRVVGKVTVIAGGGVALIGIGIGLYAKHDYNGLFEDPDGDGPLAAHCGGLPNIGDKAACDATGQSRVERDRNVGTAATIITVAGLVAAATGAVLWITAPTDEHRTVVVPTGSATSAGLAIVGRF